MSRPLAGNAFAPPQDEFRKAVIDIGSNSVRMVAFAGARRAPSLIFNEKIMAGLGSDLGETGAIGEEAFARGIAALKRFAILAHDMGLDELDCVATAAVREASNGAEFIAGAGEAGIAVRQIDGPEEARLSALGVVSTIPDAAGTVADMGGGSLELARIENGSVTRTASYPLGVLRLAASMAAGEATPWRRIAERIEADGWSDGDSGTLYLVGGSFRAVASVQMELDEEPLRVLHQYCFGAEKIKPLVRRIDAMSERDIARVPGLSFSRVPTVPLAARSLSAVVEALGSARLVVSAGGLREGVLYDALAEAVKSSDPLLAAAEAEGAKYSRLSAIGALIAGWIAPLFADEPPAFARLRTAACMVSDVAWAANPNYRAEHGLEAALHGNWSGIDLSGRVLMGQALFTCFGGRTGPFAGIPGNVPERDVEMAIRWGLAMRLAQRLSGGAGAILDRSRLARPAGAVVLTLRREDQGLYGEVIDRRMRQLAASLNAEPVLELA